LPPSPTKSSNLSETAEVPACNVPSRRDRKSGSAGMPRPISYAVFCLKKKTMQARAGESVVRTFDAPHVFLIIVCLTTGCVMLMWIGELITQKGIGNGISLLIFASIVARLPSGVQTWWTTQDQVFKVMMPFLVLA